MQAVFTLRRGSKGLQILQLPGRDGVPGTGRSPDGAAVAAHLALPPGSRLSPGLSQLRQRIRTLPRGGLCGPGGAAQNFLWSSDPLPALLSIPLKPELLAHHQFKRGAPDLAGIPGPASHRGEAASPRAQQAGAWRRRERWPRGQEGRARAATGAGLSWAAGTVPGCGRTPRHASWSLQDAVGTGSLYVLHAEVPRGLFSSLEITDTPGK